MGQYAILISWSEAAVRSVAKIPQRAEQFRLAVEGAGGRVHAFLHTLGTYDAVAVVELPSDEGASVMLLSLAAQGFARTTTLKGWTSAEFAKLAERL
jgi:uncharacterized protein with GYD domain